MGQVYFYPFYFIPTLQYYLLVDAQQRHVEWYSKNKSGTWELTETREASASLLLEALGINVPVSAIYEDAE